MSQASWNKRDDDDDNDTNNFILLRESKNPNNQNINKVEYLFD